MPDCTTATPSFLPGQVHRREVGLQGVSTILPAARKLDWIPAAHAAGRQEFEIGSFAPARLLPQRADTAGLDGGADAVGLAETVDYAGPRMGRELFAAGIDFDALVALRHRLAAWLCGEVLHGSIWRAGLPGALRAAPVETVAA